MKTTETIKKQFDRMTNDDHRAIKDRMRLAEAGTPRPSDDTPEDYALRQYMSTTDPVTHPIVLDISDLWTLGQIIYGNDGMTVFVVSGATYAVERIFLRSILHQLGFDIKSETDSVYYRDIDIATTMPWKTYMQEFAR